MYCTHTHVVYWMLCMQVPHQWDPGQFIDLIYTGRLRCPAKRKEVCILLLMDPVSVTYIFVSHMHAHTNDGYSSEWPLCMYVCLLRCACAHTHMHAHSTRTTQTQVVTTHHLFSFKNYIYQCFVSCNISLYRDTDSKGNILICLHSVSLQLYTQIINTCKIYTYWFNVVHRWIVCLLNCLALQPVSQEDISTLLTLICRYCYHHSFSLCDQCIMVRLGELL